MEEFDVPSIVSPSKGNPFEGRALLERTMRGGLVVALTDSATYWELSPSYLNALAPFFASSQRKLRVDLRTDSQKAILLFCYLTGDGKEKAVQVELPKERE